VFNTTFCNISGIMCSFIGWGN